MHQLSKLIRNRDDWKDKAVSRADEIRERRKTEKRHLGKISELKRQVEELKQAAGGNKEDRAPAAGDIARAGQPAEVRALCVSLVVQAVVSYHSVPRILGTSSKPGRSSSPTARRPT